jgi:hypothetical protein
VSEPREPLRATFDSAADFYDSARPGYPAELFDDLVVEIHVAPFEAWEGEPEAFDLVFAAAA